MASMNKAFVMGHLGRDAEMRYTKSGTAIANMSVATTEKYTDREGNKREDTQWHRVVVWGKTAETLQPYLLKGKMVLVEGKIQTREWTGNDGKKNYSTEIRSERVTLVGGGGGRDGGRRRDDDDGGQAEDPMDAQTAPVDAPVDDDIPFSWALPIILPFAMAAMRFAHATAFSM